MSSNVTQFPIIKEYVRTELVLADAVEIGEIYKYGAAVQIFPVASFRVSNEEFSRMIDTVISKHTDSKEGRLLYNSPEMYNRLNMVINHEVNQQLFILENNGMLVVHDLTEYDSKSVSNAFDKKALICTDDNWCIFNPIGLLENGTKGSIH